MVNKNILIISNIYLYVLQILVFYFYSKINIFRCGDINFSLEYEFGTQTLKLKIIQVIRFVTNTLYRFVGETVLYSSTHS